MSVGHAVGGAEIEFLILAGACLILGVFFFFQENVKPQASVVLLVVAVALGVGAFAVDSSPDQGENVGPSPVTISISQPEEGTTVPANRPLTLQVEIEGGSLTEETSGDDPTKGHLHIFVDLQLTTMPSVTTPRIAGALLPPGEHEITVEFTRADHRSFDPGITTTITVTAE